MHAYQYLYRRLSAIATAVALALTIPQTVLAGCPTGPRDTMNDTLYGVGALSNYHGLTYTQTIVEDSAFGDSALHSNDNGFYNTAVGASALYGNVDGSGHTAIGVNALYYNSAFEADDNTAIGVNALFSNTSGNINTANGAYALYSNTEGGSNTAIGTDALHYNTTGNDNMANGAMALYYNTSGYANTASGMTALLSNDSGWGNTATGYQALYNVSYSHNNIGVGFNAGYELRGSNNIDIGSNGDSGDNNTTRIGGAQNRTFIAGVSGKAVSSGVQVYINSAGQLGVMTSSERFKEDIHSVEAVADKLLQLRPVSFIYKEDDKQQLQYGLIAEEVAKVYPELVQYDQEEKPFTVYYQFLTPLLLSEMQKEHAVNDAQQTTLTAQQEEFDAPQLELAALSQQLAAQQMKMTVLLQQQQQQHVSEITALQKKLNQLDDLVQVSSSNHPSSTTVALATGH